MKHKTYKIAVLAGDGIGPEVVSQGVKVLRAVEQKYGHKFEYREALVGAAAIDATGQPYPQDTHDICMESDAVLFGAIGDPKYDNDPKAKVRPEQGLLQMRKSLGLYANVRPIDTFRSLLDKSPLKTELVDGVNFLIVRELISGIYFGKPRGRAENGQEAFDTMYYAKDEIRRICALAFKYARKRKKKMLVVDKANVLATSRLWRETVQEMAPDFSDVDIEYMFIDNATMQVITWPKKFDVVVTGNMFGDILSDAASVITGSLGLLPSASIGMYTSVFEPIHGSYPQAKGQNIANPLGTILSVAMLLEYALDMKKEAQRVRQIVQESLEQSYVTKDLNDREHKLTSEVGDWIASRI